MSGDYANITFVDYSRPFPLTILTKTTIIATTRRICMNPPIVYAVTIPRIHKAIRIVAINHNMLYHPSFIKVAQQVLLAGRIGAVQYVFSTYKDNRR